MRTIFLILFISLFKCGSSQSSFYVKWEKTYRDTIKTNPSIGLIESPRFIEKNNNEFLVVGQFSIQGSLEDELSLMKLDTFGTNIWKIIYGVGNGKIDNPIALYALPGGYQIIGESYPSTLPVFQDTLLKGLWILNIDLNGNVVSFKKVINSLNSSIYNTALKTKSGYLFGGVKGWLNTSNFTLLKTNDSGNIKWERNYGGADEDVLSKILDFDSYYLLCGSSKSPKGLDKSDSTRGGNQNFDYWIIKVDTNGNVLWDKTIGSSGSDYLNTAIKLNDSMFLLGGGSDGGINFDKTEGNKGSSDIWIVKMDVNGIIHSNKTFGTSIGDGVTNLTKIGSKIFISSTSSSNKEFDKSENSYGDNDFWIICLDSLGFKIWDKTIGDSSVEYVKGLTNIGHNLYILGSSQNNLHNPIHQDIKVVKYENGIEYKRISGSVFADFDNNCTRTLNSEFNLKNKILYNSVDSNYSVTDNNQYVFYTLNQDSAKIQLINQDSFYQSNCGLKSMKVNLSSLSKVNNVDFPLVAKKRGHCLDITSFSNGILRAGRWGYYKLDFVNNGFDTAYNAKLEITIDTSLVDSISSSFNYSLVGNKLIFSLGNVKGFETRTITYGIKLKGRFLLGTSICHKALISPACNLYTTTNYDSTKITAKTKCISKNKIELELKNESSNNQKMASDIYIYKDDSLSNLSTLKLNANETKVLTYHLDANTVFTSKLILNNNDPIHPIIILHDDKCALLDSFKSKNPVLNFHRHHDSRAYEENCDIVRGSYDPNIKSVQPAGITSENYTSTGTELSYRIDFQNTGNDTAFRIVVTDSLSESLNISTFIPGTSSHPYSVEFEKRKVKFIFDPIALVDSVTNEPGSHGYVTFKIKHNSNIKPKTKIENGASIYFDYNPPIITNKVFNTIYDVLLIVRSTSGMVKTEVLPIKVYPNPVTNTLNIGLNEAVPQLSIEVLDIQGKLVKKIISPSDLNVQINTENMENGIYILRCYSLDKVIIEQKIQVIK